MNELQKEILAELDSISDGAYLRFNSALISYMLLHDLSSRDVAKVIVEGERSKLAALNLAMQYMVKDVNKTEDYHSICSIPTVKR